MQCHTSFNGIDTFRPFTSAQFQSLVSQFSLFYEERELFLLRTYIHYVFFASPVLKWLAWAVYVLLKADSVTLFVIRMICNCWQNFTLLSYLRNCLDGWQSVSLVQCI